MLELNCAQPDFWDLTPGEYRALTEHWKKMMTRQGYKLPPTDTPDARRADQLAMLAALKSLTNDGPK